jgi:transcription elongation factor GreA
MEKWVYLTQEGFEKFQTELDYLRSTKRVEIAHQLREVGRFDDDQFDTEFQLAKDEQSLNEGRIHELESLLAKAKILKPQSSNGEITLGSVVMVQEEGLAPEEFTIVCSVESNSSHGLISDESPLGSSLLGHKMGDEVDVKAPNGRLKYQILGVK